MATAHAQSPHWTTLSRAALCVTEGALEQGRGQGLSVDVPKMRAYANQVTAEAAQLRFTYLGPSATTSALASGASRVQFGLKLRAADPCNLVYVMWRVEPESRLVVSIKSNAGQHASSQCGNRGYQNIRPTLSAPIPRLGPGQSHVLSATLSDDALRAFVDERLIWQGELGPLASGLHGPAGVRTDNAHLNFQLAVDSAAAPSAPVPACRTGLQESD